MKPTDFAIALSDWFVKYLPNERGLSDHTFRTYKCSFVIFIQGFLEGHKKIDADKFCLKDFTEELVIEFLDWLEKERKNSIQTRNLRLDSFKSFFHFLRVKLKDPSLMSEIQRVLSIKSKRGPKHQATYLTKEGIKLLLKQPDVTTIAGRRDLALLSLLYDTGARVSEFARISFENVRLDSRPIVTMFGKGAKWRTVPLLDTPIVHLKNYISEFKIESLRPKGPLFYNKQGERIGQSGYHYILSKYADKARNENSLLIPSSISCHTLRHSKAMHLLAAGVPIINIRDFLGHVDINTTEIYAKLDPSHNSETFNKANENLGPGAQPIWKGESKIMQFLKKFLSK